MSENDNTARSNVDLTPYLDELIGYIRDGDRKGIESFLRQLPEHAAPQEDPISIDATATFAGAPGFSTTNREGLPPLLGDFELVREIGRGGMGIVFEAKQLSLDKLVALKILPVAGVLDPNSLQRFQNEARAAAQLQHPNIVPVHAVGSDRGVHFYAMQFIDGVNFAELISSLREFRKSQGSRATLRFATQPTSTIRASAGSTEPARPSGDSFEFIGAISSKPSSSGRDLVTPFVQSGIQLANALHYAHSMGIVHRDIKPANIILDEQGTTWLTDFGLAQIQGNPGMTVTGNIVGTLRYMSPEQAYANRVIVDHRTDIYSLGVTLYELLALRPAVEGQLREEVLRRLAFEEPPALRKIDRQIPVELETIIMKAIAKNPDERYQSGKEMAEDLERFQRDEPIRARPPTPAERVVKWTRKHKRTVGTAISLATVLFVATTITAVVVYGALQDAMANLRRSEGLRLVAHSQLQLDHDPALALTLAIEGAKLHEGLEATNALASALDTIRETQTLDDHRERVGQVDISRDGSLVVSTGDMSNFVSGSQPVQVWDAKTGNLLKTLSLGTTSTSAVFSPSGGRILATSSPHPNALRDEPDSDGSPPVLWSWETDRKTILAEARLWAADRRAFSPDGQFVITPAAGNAAVIWDVVDGHERRRFDDHSKPVVFAAFGPSGQRAVTVSHDNTVRIRELESGRTHKLDLWQRQARTAGDGVIGSVAFSPDGRRLVTGSRTAGVHVWDCDTGQVVNSDRIPGSSAEFTADGEYLVVSASSRILIYDADTLRVNRELEGDGGIVRGFAISPDSTLVAVWMYDARIRVWSVESGQLRFELRGHQGAVTSAVFSENAEQLVTGSFDNTARIWNMSSGAELRRLSEKANVERSPLATFSPDGSALLVATPRADLIQIRPTDNLSAQNSFAGYLTLPQRLRSGVLRILNDRVSLIAAQTGEEIATIGIKSGLVPTQAVLSPSGEQAVITARRKIWRWRIGSGQLDRVVGVGLALRAEFDVSGAMFVVHCEDGAVRVCNTATGEVLHSLHQTDQDPMVFCRCGPQKGQLLTISNGKRLTLWDTTAGVESSEFSLADGSFSAAEFNFDGTRVVAFDEVGCREVVCWDIASAQVRGRLQLEQPATVSIGIHPSLNRVAVATDANGLVLWDTDDDSSEPLTAAAASCVAFLPSGKLIASLRTAMEGQSSAAQYGAAAFRVWDSGTGEVLDEFPTNSSSGHRLELARDADSLVVHSSSYGVSVFNSSAMDERMPIAMHVAPLSFASFTPDGKQIISASLDGTAAIWNAKTGVEIKRLRGHAAAITTAAISADGKLLATTDANGNVRLWDTLTGALRTEFTNHSDAVSVAHFSYDGQHLLTASRDQTTRVTTISGEELLAVRSENAVPHRVEFAPDSDRFLVVPRPRPKRGQTRSSTVPPEHHIEIYEGFGGASFRIAQEHAIRDAKFTPDGHRALVVNQESVELWDLANRQRLRRFAQDREVISVHPFPQGSRVLAVSPRQLTVWDSDTGTELMSRDARDTFLPTFGGPSVSADGQRFVTVASDGTVECWISDVVGAARLRRTRDFSDAERTRFHVNLASALGRQSTVE